MDFGFWIDSCCDRSGDVGLFWAIVVGSILIWRNLARGDRHLADFGEVIGALGFIALTFKIDTDRST
ncbi:MAG: hypothetical protein VKJ24_04095 [Synechococcales bacterium]|nr:hypothetical protein [Synechococcales bacterium]